MDEKSGFRRHSFSAMILICLAFWTGQAFSAPLPKATEKILKKLHLDEKAE